MTSEHQRRQAAAEAKKKEREAMTPEMRQVIALEAIQDSIAELLGEVRAYTRRPNPNRSSGV